MKIKKGDWIAISMSLGIIIVICCWCVDVSVSAMNVGKDTIMMNAFWSLNPIVTYHLGLYGIILCVVALLLIIIYNTLKEEA